MEPTHTSQVSLTSEEAGSQDNLSQQSLDVDVVSLSANQLPKDAESQPPKQQNQKENLTLKEALEKFENSDVPAELNFNVLIKPIYLWASDPNDPNGGKTLEEELKVNVQYDANNQKLIGSGEVGACVYEDENGFYYIPPRIKVSALLLDLVNDTPELKPLVEVFDIDLVLRKIELTFHRIKDSKSPDDNGCYFSIALYADEKFSLQQGQDDDDLLYIPNTYGPPLIPSEEDAPEVAEAPFCILGIGKNDNKKNWWFHLCLSLRSIFTRSNLFDSINNNKAESDAWGIVLPVINCAVSFGDPFLTIGRNLSLSPKDYLELAKRFLVEKKVKEEKDKDGNDKNPEDFYKEDYILEDRTQVRVGVTVKVDDFAKDLVFEYPKSSPLTESQPSASIGNRTTLFPSQENTTELVQKYGTVFDPGIVRFGPLCLNKIGLGIEERERKEPGNNDLKSKKLCLVIKPNILVGKFPQKDKSHAYADISGLSIYVIIGDELEKDAPSNLIPPVEFEFNSFGIDIANRDIFRLKGAGYWKVSDKKFEISAEIMLRLGPAQAPKLLLQILMSIWLEDEWGFYVYGLALFSPIKIPLDPVFTQTYLKGFALGLGINSQVAIPPIDEITEFPLIKAIFTSDIEASPKPKDAVKEMEPYLKPKPGNHWFAVGAEISTLETFKGFALFVGQIGFGENLTWDLCLLAVLTFADPAKKVYLIELIFKVQVGWYGFKIEFLIRDSSFLLDKQLTLKGSGYFWFFWDTVDGFKAGDILFVLGGYHPTFKKPEHYPSPTSISMGYERDFGILKFLVRGSAYFAIDKKAVMLGCRVELYAYVNIIFEWTISALLALDFLIFFSPFELDGSISISIRVKAVVILIFVPVSIEVGVGLRLDIWKSEGEDFGGQFIFKVLAWTIKAKFGGPKLPIDPMTFDEFLKEYLGLEDPPNPIMIGCFNSDESGGSGSYLPTEVSRFLKTQSTQERIDYEVVGRFQEEPFFEAISQVPIKTLEVNSKVVDRTWNDKFGLHQCLNTAGEFKTTFRVVQDKLNTSAPFRFGLKINPTQLYANDWSPVYLEKPDLQGEGIANTLLGVTVSLPEPKLGRKVGSFTTSALIRHRKSFVWPSITLPLSSPTEIGISSFMKDINSEQTRAKRNKQINAIRDLQPEIRRVVRLNNTAESANLVLRATPTVATLGK